MDPFCEDCGDELGALGGVICKGCGKTLCHGDAFYPIDEETPYCDPSADIMLAGDSADSDRRWDKVIQSLARLAYLQERA